MLNVYFHGASQRLFTTAAAALLNNTNNKMRCCLPEKREPKMREPQKVVGFNFVRAARKTTTAAEVASSENYLKER